MDHQKLPFYFALSQSTEAMDSFNRRIAYSQHTQIPLLSDKAHLLSQIHIDKSIGLEPHSIALCEQVTALDYSMIIRHLEK